MANIRVDVNYTIKDGSEIVFRSPVDCTAITGLIVYYQAEDGNTTSKEFAFADAHGNNVGDIPHLFAESVVVKVILDVTSGMAFVQNADTNAYLEGRFAEMLPKPVMVSASNGGYVADKTFTEIKETYNNGHTVCCYYQGLAYPLVLMSEEVISFMLAMPGYSSFINIYPDNTVDGVDYKSSITINGQIWSGDAPTDFTSTINAMIEAKDGSVYPSVKKYGAVGDGSGDDTQAFENALAENRVVFVPGGTYNLSGTLVIRPNCCLELSQDTVLNFTQTSGNCIEMRSSATLRGNHGIINVPYAFAGHVIDIVTTHDTLADTEPYTHWTPMWKRGRYIYDVSIVKANPSGLHYSTDGVCSGTGIYMSGDGNNDVRFIWGALLQGIRIGGAFTRGIHAINFDLEGKEDSAWNHDTRIEAVLHGCETSVDLTNCNGVHLAVAVQPRIAENDTKYAKWGVYLNDCRFVDMASSVIWDWDEKNTLYTSGSEYTAVAMYGKCWGLVYYDYCYHTNGTATRNRIYTDTPSNLEKMTIVQEPITRWFKQVEGVPYYHDGNTDKKLATQDDLDTYFDADIVKGFTDVLATATDTDGTIYNGVGYKVGYRLNTDGTLIASADNTYTATGFMPIAVGQKMYVEGMSLASVDDTCRFCLYDSDKKFLRFVAGTLVNTGTNYYIDYEETENGFWIVPNGVSGNNGTAYIRFNLFTRMTGERPMISVGEEIKYTVEGFLADGVKVKGDTVILTSQGGKAFKLAVKDDGTLYTTS